MMEFWGNNEALTAPDYKNPSKNWDILIDEQSVILL